MVDIVIWFVKMNVDELPLLNLAIIKALKAPIILINLK